MNIEIITEYRAPVAILGHDNPTPAQLQFLYAILPPAGRPAGPPAIPTGNKPN